MGVVASDAALRPQLRLCSVMPPVASREIRMHVDGHRSKVMHHKPATTRAELGPGTFPLSRSPSVYATQSISTRRTRRRVVQPRVDRDNGVLCDLGRVVLHIEYTADELRTRQWTHKLQCARMWFWSGMGAWVRWWGGVWRRRWCARSRDRLRAKTCSRKRASRWMRGLKCLGAVPHWRFRTSMPKLCAPRSSTDFANVMPGIRIVPLVLHVAMSKRHSPTEQGAGADA